MHKTFKSIEDAWVWIEGLGGDRKIVNRRFARTWDFEALSEYERNRHDGMGNQIDHVITVGKCICKIGIDII